METIADILEKFEEILYKKVSPRTHREYVFVAKQLLMGTLTALTINSQSKLQQAKAVEKKLLEYHLISERFQLPDKIGRHVDPIAYIEKKYVSEKQFKQYLEGLPKTTKGKELKMAGLFAYYGGFRLQEVLNLYPDNFHLNKHIVVRFMGKGEKSRKTRLPKSLKEMIKIFQGFTVSYTYIQRMTIRHLKKVGIQSSFHGFRHSCATNWAKNGVPIHVIQSLLGHGSLSITGRYLHFTDDSCPELDKMGY
jgi:integrase